MKTKGLIYAFLAFVVFHACSKRSAAEFNSDFSLFKGYISGCTGGIVSTSSDIRVVLAFDKKEWIAGQPVGNDLFTISPAVSGKIVALSSNTLSFIPEKKLDQNTEYQVTFHLSKLIQVKKKLSDFNFTVKTINQDFTVETKDIQSYDTQYQYLNIILKSADNMDAAVATKLLSASQQGKPLTIKLLKGQSSATEFHFVVDSIRRFKENTKVEIGYDGSQYDMSQRGKISYPIAGRDDFRIMQVLVPQGNNQELQINFSEILLRAQDFKGLVSVESAHEPKYAVQGNVLKVFFDAPLKGNPLLEVFQGIQSQDGFKLKSTFSQRVSFEQIKPNVRFAKNGTILPTSRNLNLNFEAVNLRAVDVKIYKIYRSNILQFLQDNKLNGSENLREVSQPVARTTIDLKQNKLLNFSKWNTFALDLSKIIKPDPGAMYRVQFSFKKEYSLYECQSVQADNEEDEDQSEEPEEALDENDVNYSNYYNDYYYNNYEWREEQDPCSNSYYYNTKVATNILATDLGVIVKRGENKSVLVAVNNILTTETVCGAKVALYSFQQQKIASATTNSDGLATFKLNKFAYFAIVSSGGQSTYVRLDDGQSLSVSNFDVAGAELQKGLKGYIYGERGVWRPGDNLYLSFILDDAANKLPKNHPIKLRLSDPNGKITYQNVIKSNGLNHYAFTVPISPDAPTGSWEAMVSVGGAKFYKSIKIETIKPNRLRIKSTFSSPILSSARPNNANLEVTWLHGAVAKNLKVEVQARFSQQQTAFKNYPDYRFDDITRQFSSEEISIFSGRIDAAGKASVKIDPKLEGQAPGMLKAAFITKVYEEGGDVSTDVTATTYSPYKTYVGIKSPEANKYGMLETRRGNRFDIVTVDEDGRPKSVHGLEVRIFKTEWRWWWDASEDDLSNFNSSNVTTPFRNFIVNTDESGKASIAFAVSDDQWGRYLIRVADPYGGHATAQTVLVDWPSWSGKTRSRDASTANMLVFTTDKKKYSVGEKARISFPSSAGGRALISIENGSEVLSTVWAPTVKGETKVDIPVTAAMAPNVYFNITLLQPHANTKNDSPIRMYGLVPIEVFDKNTVLEPQIVMPDVLKPEQPFNIRVSERTGHAMTYTIAVVDDGLLDLTRFKTPNAWDDFYAREALGVRTWDVYDDVIGAYGGKISQIFSIGGDQDLGGGKAKKANRFKPVVVFLGPYVLKKGQSATHKIQLPKYIGSVRAMVVAADAGTSAYGRAEKTAPVRSPLMVLASLPRKISPSERVTMPVTVFAMENRVKNVSIAIKTENGLQVVGSSSQNLTFSQPDEKLAYFDLAVGAKTGIAKVRVTATSGSLRSSYDVEIDMTNPNPVTHIPTDIVLNGNNAKTISWKTFGTDGSNKARIEISSVPTIDLNRRLQYLIEYPHGCVEQTTSAVFPQLFLDDMADIDNERKARIQQNVTAGINRLGGFQVPSGGFSYWPGEGVADDWGSSYAGHFLIEAEKKGYLLPAGLKSKWISSQQREARTWRFYQQYGNDIAQAYRLYTLALAGSPELSAMNRMRETTGISNESRFRLAAAYAVAGQKQAAMSLLSKTSVEDDYSRHAYYYYGSPERNRAMALETLVLLGQKQQAFAMAVRLAKDMASPEWMSTQTTAYSLLAMSEFARTNGGKGIDVVLGSEKISTMKSIANRSLTVKTGANGVTIKNSKGNTLFIRLLNSGILPVGKEQPAQRNLSAKIVFKTRKGLAVNISKIAQGTEFIAEVTIRNMKNERVENVALTQILPSGFEIVNTRFTDYGDAADNKADYIDIRDDRTNFYFAMKANETKTFRVLLNASYLGTYYMPGLQCEAMYDHSFLARTKGQWVAVVK